MKKIYIPTPVSLLIIAAISIGATLLVLHVISTMSLLQVQEAQAAGL